MIPYHQNGEQEATNEENSASAPSKLERTLVSNLQDAYACNENPQTDY